MLFYCALLFLLPTIRASVFLKPPNICPICIDDSYEKFIEENPRFFENRDERDYYYFVRTSNFSCLQNVYGTRICANSCIRMHLKQIVNDTVKSIGWMYDCGTDVVQRVPNNPVGSLPDMRRLTTDLDFVDTLFENSTHQIVYDITMYGRADTVEETKKYYQRKYKESQEAKHGQSDSMMTLLESLIFSKAFIFGIILVALFVMFMDSLHKTCRDWNRKDHIDPTARIAFSNGDSDELELITNAAPIYGSVEERA